MNKKLISSLVAGLALSATVPAQAITLSQLNNYVGPYTMTVSMADMGTTTYLDGFGNPTGCTGAANCDTYGSVGVGSEDSWGIFRVTAIATNIGSWTPGAANGGFLTGMYYGLIDQNVTVSTSPGLITWTSEALGGKLDIYLNAADVGTGLLSSVSPGDRIGTNGFTGISDTGSLYYSADLYSSSTRYSYYGTNAIDTDTGDVTGGTTRLALLNVTGGFAAGQYDTNTKALGTDTSLSIAVQCTNEDITSQVPACGTWTVVGSGTAVGNKIPEPGSMALLGLGLMGLAGLRRRKQQA